MNVRPIPAARRGIPRNTLSVAVIGFLLVLIGAGATEARGNTPTIRLFPTTVVEDLRQTSNVAREMETGLQEVIHNPQYFFSAVPQAQHQAGFDDQGRLEGGGPGKKGQ